MVSVRCLFADKELLQAPPGLAQVPVGPPAIEPMTAKGCATPVPTALDALGVRV